MRIKTAFPIMILALLAISACSGVQVQPTAVTEPTQPVQTRPPTNQVTPQVVTPGNSGTQPPASEELVEVIAEELEIPWEIAFLSNGDILITERPGRLLLLGGDRKVIEVEGVHHSGEGGLLGMVLHPNFVENHWLYLYLTSRENGIITNRVERYTYGDHTLSDRMVILDGILGSSVHDGGRMEFGPDGYLYITTGDAGEANLAQDINSLNGKILRVIDDGKIPVDNPFGNAVYSYGHRNPQGLTWDDQGRLWETEHGPSGLGSGFDELNLIEPGSNYGWPVIQGEETREGMVTPVLQSGSSETWAPGDAEFIDGVIYFSGLRGATLYAVQLNGTEVVSLEKFLVKEYGRLRGVRLGPDGFLYLTTSNRDGRGTPDEGDDKLLKINLGLLPGN